jgi:hypothetical protein
MIQAATEALTRDALAPVFAARHPTDPWFHVRIGPHVTADGAVRPLDAGGIRVAPEALHREAGTPMFTVSLAPESLNGGIPAANDHPKWLAYINDTSSAGYPGIDALPGTELSGSARLSGRTFGTERHPFGGAVSNSSDDPRLATVALTTIDLESWMAFDFLFTNQSVYVFYERLPFGRADGDDHAAFSYAVPIEGREENDVHAATIAYDVEAGTVRWILDGVEVHRVARLGRHLQSREHLLIDLVAQSGWCVHASSHSGSGCVRCSTARSATAPVLYGCQTERRTTRLAAALAHCGSLMSTAGPNRASLDRARSVGSVVPDFTSLTCARVGH